jgi:glycosyltransferase involved in cell wall biosynthesis
MKIHFLCSSGSPTGLVPADIYGRGVGGAELAMMTLTEKLASRNHEVVVYNNPHRVGTYDGVRYAPVSEFRPDEDRDAVILYRTPHPSFKACKGRKVFWSCDQYTTGNFVHDIFDHAERIVCISPRHAEFFQKHYQLAENDPRVMVVNLGVRTQDYPKGVEKIPGRMIYCSVPARGLMNLHAMWPKIREKVPEAQLVITSDYRLWGAGPEDHQYRLSYMGLPGITYLGNIPRKDLCIEQLRAEMMVFPNEYDELFCISCAECAYARALPITSVVGALDTTNRFGVRIEGNPRSENFRSDFVRHVAWAYNNPLDADVMRDTCKLHALTDFNWDALVLIWEQQVLV